MSRKDYRAFASAIKALAEGQRAGFTPSLRDVTIALAGVMAQDNPNFDLTKFMEACDL